MKIIQVTPRYYPHIGGIETHVQKISERLIKNGFEVEVISTDPTGGLDKHEIINGVKITRFRSLAPGDAYYLAPQIYFYLRSSNCDIIHMHSYHSFTSLFSALAKKNRKLIITPHTFGFPATFPKNIFHNLYKPFGSFIFDSADKVISISRIEKEWLSNTFGIPDTKLYHIPIPIDIDNVNKKKERGKDIKIAFMGRLSAEKNVDVLISAFRIVKQDHPECKLYIIGEGPLKEHLSGLSKNINDIYFLGRLTHDDTLKFFDDVDMFVLPSKFEVSPISVLEAMAKSVPVIVTPVGEIPYVLEDGKNCLLVKFNDVNDLAVKINSLVENKTLSNRIAENGRNYVKEKHDINKIIDSYVNLYTS